MPGIHRCLIRSTVGPNNDHRYLLEACALVSVCGGLHSGLWQLAAWQRTPRVAGSISIHRAGLHSVKQEIATSRARAHPRVCRSWPTVPLLLLDHLRCLRVARVAPQPIQLEA